MMKYLAIPQATTDWLLRSSEYRAALVDDLATLAQLYALREGVLVAGSLRAAACSKGTVLAVWNTDYLSSMGDEEWGIIRLSPPIGLFDANLIMPEVFERCLYVINQRLQRLLLDGTFIHRSWPNHVHTCLAGRGADARATNIAYTEGDVQIETSLRRAVLCIGPCRDFEPLRNAAAQDRAHLERLSVLANEIITSSTRRPAVDNAVFTHLLDRFRPEACRKEEVEGPIANVPALSAGGVSEDDTYRTQEWRYERWIDPSSPLTSAQRSILESDVILRQPTRILGSAGSGKTLLMQLLAMRQLRAAQQAGRPLRMLYVVHNAAMMNTVWTRFLTLGAEDSLQEDSVQQIHVRTLFEHSREALQIETESIIDPDASASKAFQLSVVAEHLQNVLREHARELSACPLLSQVASNRLLVRPLSELVAAEIGMAIKGHGLTDDERRYVESEQRLSRLHGVLTQKERQLIFQVFQAYHRAVFEELEVFDSDDLAITLLAHLRTPLWKMKRKREGYEFVFVDETQLFNENERKLFSLLTNRDSGHLRIVLALDEAQELRGVSASGFGRLGIEEISDHSLFSVHRCTKAILSLAFHIIQRTTDLFGPDFPDFTAQTVSFVPDDHRFALPPRLLTVGSASGGLPKTVGKQVRALRSQNLRQIGVVVHAEKYWDEIVAFLQGQGLPLQVLRTRGERIDPQRPVVALGTPASIGGQEFDAVIAVGLEQGLVPPRVEGHAGLACALEQQALREMYLSFTRARYQLILVNSAGAAPTSLLQDAIRDGLLVAEA